MNMDLVFGLEGPKVRDLSKLQRESQQDKIEMTDRTSMMLERL